MAGSYYEQSNTKLLLNIASGDTADDTLLDALGALADQHIDNILKLHDEKIPLQSTNVLNDIQMAANFYTASLYKARREDTTLADHWMKEFDKVIQGIKEERIVENHTYTVPRFQGRRGRGDHDHFFAEWI